ncbi:MAG: LysR family transcriptional regulator [Verrucomicrobiaceae bacterium]|nr:MAG: LysR family transcriptional regulator [Verrucomicrobiaceae bacterium]
MDLELTSLLVLRSVAETGSFTEAAKCWGITQPAVSTFISRLESSVGLVLLERLSSPACRPWAGGWAGGCWWPLTAPPWVNAPAGRWLEIPRSQAWRLFSAKRTRSGGKVWNHRNMTWCWRDASCRQAFPQASRKV